ncbi:MAG: GNAT family N-acetyltransferase [Planctomycetaceae bacterium]|nr:GNAT family N-acetyltransferase [Planctomycetaceae bacterium]
MVIRPYRDADVDAVAAIFIAAVHEGAASHYDVAQREAWAPRQIDAEYWRQRLASLVTLVAEINASPVGFLSFGRNGHIDLLFVSPQSVRRGVASALLQSATDQLAALGVSELFTEASLVARPFFERHGFVATEEETVERRGVTLRRYAMAKRLP